MTVRIGSRSSPAAALLALLGIIAAACGPSPAAQPTSAGATPTQVPTAAPTEAAKPPAQKITLRFSHGVTADTSRGRAAELFARRVNELTGGQVTVQVFHNATLGSEAQAIEGMQTGSIDMGVITIYTNAVKAGSVFDLPFLFRDFEHWKASVDGKPGQLVTESAAGTGLQIVGYWVGGWRDVYGARPINRLEDFKGLKIRTLQTPAYVELFKAFGAIPTPIAWPETYLALQQKTVDAAETALPSMYDAKQYEVARYIATTRHGLSTTAFLVSEQRWKALTPAVQDAIVKAEKEAREFQREGYLKEDADIVKLLKEKGAVFTSPDLAPFRSIAKSIYPKLVTDPAQQRVLDEIQRP